jgi:hypothetical protein
VALGLVPLLVGERPLSASALRVLGDVGMPLLIGHVVYGLILGTGFRLVLDRLSPPGSSGHTQPGMRRAAYRAGIRDRPGRVLMCLSPSSHRAVLSERS